MLGNQLRQDLVLGLDLLLQVSDPLLVGGMVRSRLQLEGGRAVLEELLLPAVEDRGLQAELIADKRGRRTQNEVSILSLINMSELQRQTARRKILEVLPVLFDSFRQLVERSRQKKAPCRLRRSRFQRSSSRSWGKKRRQLFQPSQTTGHRKRWRSHC